MTYKYLVFAMMLQKFVALFDDADEVFFPGRCRLCKE